MRSPFLPCQACNAFFNVRLLVFSQVIINPSPNRINANRYFSIRSSSRNNLEADVVM